MNARSTDGKIEVKGLDTTIPLQQVRAKSSETTVRVYQAFSEEIAKKATAAQTFVPPSNEGG